MVEPPKPVAQKATVVGPLDPEQEASNRARIECCNALFMKLRTTWPALFATKKPPPLAIGAYDALVQRLGLDVEGRLALRVVLGQHVNRYRYQKALSREGAVRVDLNGNASEVTDKQRERAAKQVAKFKAKAAKARDGK